MSAASAVSAVSAVCTVGANFDDISFFNRGFPLNWIAASAASFWLKFAL